jgi:hypothetical protein
VSVLTNATLIEIARPGALAANGDPGDPVVVWSGAAAGYLKRIRSASVSGGETTYVRRDTFTLLASAGAPVLEQAGANWEAYTVVIDDQRGLSAVRRRFTVRGMENRAAGTPVDSIRLELDREAAA